MYTYVHTCIHTHQEGNNQLSSLGQLTPTRTYVYTSGGNNSGFHVLLSFVAHNSYDAILFFCIVFSNFKALLIFMKSETTCVLS